MAKDLEETRDFLDQYDAVKIRIKTILEKGTQFHEQIWGDDEAFWEWANKHPERFKARYASFSLFFSKFAPTKIIHENPNGDRRRVTADKLEGMDLTPEQIEKLAFAEEQKPDGENE